MFRLLPPPKAVTCADGKGWRWMLMRVTDRLIRSQIRPFRDRLRHLKTAPSTLSTASRNDFARPPDFFSDLSRPPDRLSRRIGEKYR